MIRSAIDNRTSAAREKKGNAMSLRPLTARLDTVSRRLASAALLGTLLFGAVAMPALAADLDTDGLDDDWETRTGHSLPFDGDSDEDELGDGKEWQLGTNALNPDTDGDGIKDGIELHYTYNTNPLSADTDSDGVRDWDEIVAGTDPLVANNVPAPAPEPAPGERPDRDGDGLFDDDETNVYGTNPDVFDSDGDGDSDGLEVYNGTDPLG